MDMAMGETIGSDLAFPFVETGAMQGESINFGLSKRELFAAMAMQGVVSGINSAQIAAQMAVEHADALILALSRNGADHA